MIIRYNNIENEKISSNIKICLFSDIHYSNIFDIDRFKQIYDDLYLNNPDYICIPGDIIDSTNILENKKFLNDLLYFFEDISKLAPIIISTGNHDFTKLQNNRWHPDYNLELFEKLNSMNNITVLNNEILEIKDTRFIGITLPFDYYFNDTKEENEDILIKEFLSQIPYINDDKLNILLCHSPICILNDKVINEIEYLKNIRLILTGHMHNGMVPGIIDEIFGGTKGLIYPNKKLFPKYARGITTTTIDNKDVTMVMTGGITKIQESAPKILHFVDELYQPQINYIKIKSLKKTT